MKVRALVPKGEEVDEGDIKIVVTDKEGREFKISTILNVPYLFRLVETLHSVIEFLDQRMDILSEPEVRIQPMLLDFLSFILEGIEKEVDISNDNRLYKLRTKVESLKYKDCKMTRDIYRELLDVQTMLFEVINPLYSIMDDDEWFEELYDKGENVL